MTLFVECRRAGGRNSNIGGIIPVRDANSTFWTENLPTEGVTSNNRVPTTGVYSIDDGFVLVLHPTVDMYVDVNDNPNALDAGRVMRLRADVTEMVAASPNARVQWQPASATLNQDSTMPWRFSASRLTTHQSQKDAGAGSPTTGQGSANTNIVAGRESAFNRIAFMSPPYPVSVHKIAFANWFVDGGNFSSGAIDTGGVNQLPDTGRATAREVNGRNDILIAGATLEIINAATFPTSSNATFTTILFGASATKTLVPGETVWSDDISVTIPPNSLCFVRSVITAAIGAARPAGYRPAAVGRYGKFRGYSLDRVTFSATEATLTTGLTTEFNSNSGSILNGVNCATSTGGGAMGGAICMVSRTPANIPVVLTVGDSIGFGEQASQSPVFWDESLQRGFFGQGISREYGAYPRIVSHIGNVPGTRAAIVLDPEDSTANFRTVNTLGTASNDVPANTTTAQPAAAASSVFALRKAMYEAVGRPFTHIISNMGYANTVAGSPLAQPDAISLASTRAFIKFLKDDLGGGVCPVAQTTLTNNVLATGPAIGVEPTEVFTTYESQTPANQGLFDTGTRGTTNTIIRNKVPNITRPDIKYIDDIIDVESVLYRNPHYSKWPVSDKRKTLVEAYIAGNASGGTPNGIATATSVFINNGSFWNAGSIITLKTDYGTGGAFTLGDTVCLINDNDVSYTKAGAGSAGAVISCQDNGSGYTVVIHGLSGFPNRESATTVFTWPIGTRIQVVPCDAARIVVNEAGNPRGLNGFIEYVSVHPSTGLTRDLMVEVSKLKERGFFGNIPPATPFAGLDMWNDTPFPILTPAIAGTTTLTKTQGTYTLAGTVTQQWQRMTSGAWANIASATATTYDASAETGTVVACLESIASAGTGGMSGMIMQQRSNFIVFP